MKKEENIIVRVDKQLKDRLKNHCIGKNTTISKIVNDYLEDLVEPMTYEMSLIYSQLKTTNSISNENITLFKLKNFHSGRKKKIGDKILFGFLHSEEQYKLIEFHIDEVNKFYIVKPDNTNPTKFPYLILNND